MANSLTFNGYDLSDYGLYVNRSNKAILPSKKSSSIDIPYRHGVISPASVYSARTLSFDCIIRATSHTQAKSYINSIAGILNETEDCTIVDQGTDTTKFFNGRLSNSFDVSETGPSVFKTQLNFICSDPFAYSTSSTTVNHNITSTDTTKSFSVLGDTKTYATITLTADATITNNISISNTDNDNEIIICGQDLVSDDILIFYCDPDDYRITFNGNITVASQSGYFPTLAGGDTNYIRYRNFSGSSSILYTARFLTNL